MSLERDFLNTIRQGLKRKSIVTCSKWSETYRKMGNPFPGKWSFEHHPWLLEMHDAESSTVVGQKAAQMGYTEWAMNTSFFCLDVLGLDVLYILPTSDDASDFSAGRFDPALEQSEHLRNLFSDVNNVGMKRAGSNTLYVRGSHSRSKLKSIPTPVVIFDETDEMPRASINLAKERQSGQKIHKTLYLSTPSIEDFGINVEYKLSTEEHFFFKCPLCSRHTELTFPESLVITGESLTDPNLKNSYLQCKECKTKLDHETKSEWLKHKLRGGTAEFVAAHPGRDARGFHIGQLYSMVLAGNPYNLALAYLRGIFDPTAAQEFHNSKLGICFEAKGARVTEEQINNVIRSYRKGPTGETQLRTLGIDVGSVLHMVVKEWTPEAITYPGMSPNENYRPRVVFEGTSSGSVNDFDEAFQCFMDYGCTAGVCDAEPERREALKFAQRLYGRVFLCDYLFSQSGREITYNETELTCKVNRTAWLDLALGRYKSGKISLPADVSEEFRRHIREPVRIYRQDKWGNPYGVYENVKADHFAHADTYAEIALPFALGSGANQTIVKM